MPAKTKKPEQPTSRKWTSADSLGQSAFAIDYLRDYHNDEENRQQSPRVIAFLKIFLAELHQFEIELHEHIKPGYLDVWAWILEVPPDDPVVVSANGLKQDAEEHPEQVREQLKSPSQWLQIQTECVKALTNRAWKLAIEIWKEQEDPSPDFYWWVYSHINTPILKDRDAWLTMSIETLKKVVPMWQASHFQVEVQSLDSDLANKLAGIRSAILLKVEAASGRQERALDAIRVKVRAAEQPPTEMPAMDGEDSARRAKTVASLLRELAILKPTLFGRSDYEEQRLRHSDMLTFQIADTHSLVDRVIHDSFSRKNIRLAIDLAARHYGRKPSTIDTDWKHHKPPEFRRAKQGTPMNAHKG